MCRPLKSDGFNKIIEKNHTIIITQSKAVALHSCSTARITKLLSNILDFNSHRKNLLFMHTLINSFKIEIKKK